MKQTVTEAEFVRAFETYGREANFSVEGRRALFAYLEDLEEESATEIELDVIGLCCDYAEYESLAAFQADYGDEYETLESIEDMTTWIPVDIRNDDGRFIVASF